jgi:hypothetical protein
MNIHLFDLKSEMINRGITSLDFMENNFRVNYEDPKLIISKIFLVEDKHLCRPDMLSFDAYGLPDYVDIILKFNHISNPFSMELYDLIIVPKLNTAIKFYRKDPLKTEKILNDTKGLFVDPTRASKKDQERIKMLQEIAKKSKNGATEIKPTNLLRDGEVPFTSNGDIIVFAPNSSAPRKQVNSNDSPINSNNSVI